MNRWKLLLLWGSFFCSLSMLAQNRGEELLAWDAKRKLCWDDFKAAPVMGSDAVASTATLLTVEYKIGNREFGYKISSCFSKTDSWAKYMNDYILTHEQGHFDIAEVFARKLHKKMKAYQFNRYTYQQDLDRIYNEILLEKEAMQQAYDRETDHSRNKNMQAIWLKKIAGLLEEYQAYAMY